MNKHRKYATDETRPCRPGGASVTVTQPLKRFGSAVLAVAAGIVLTACVDGTQLAEGGIRGTGMSVGPLTAFGSVYVNGIQFETNEADFVDNDGVSAESDLQKGMILVVDGQWRRDTREGTAEQVLYDDTLRGTVEAIVLPWDAANKTGELTVLGQTVLLDGQTVFRGQSPEVIAQGNAIRVSGWRLNGGGFRASYVETQDANVSSLYATVEVEGEISDASETEFKLGTLKVSYTPDLVDITLSADQLNGRYVDVEGTFDQGENILSATDIQFIDQRYLGNKGDEIELSGAITDGYSDVTRQFQLGGLTVLVDAEALEEDGLELTDLVVDFLVTVEGEFDDQGRIVAEEVELSDGDAEVSGALSNLAVTDELGNMGSLTVGGVRVVVDARTVITNDDLDEKINLFQLIDSDQIEVEGIVGRDDEGVFLRAVKIEKEDAEDGFELAGPVEAFDADTIKVLGVTIEAPTDFDMTSLPVGGWVEVEYTEVGGLFVADEIELENDDEDED
ncbi:MAG: DUF5666 domain-containing protein [Saccharospirillum sp.]